MDAIMAFMSGVDVFLSLPTGYGKSMIYAMLPMAFDLYKEQQGSIVICISPLISLMIDQRSKFQAMGIVTEFVGEDQCDSSAMRRVLAGEVQLVYKLVATIVDEAHCVKTWGDSFRAAYAHLGDTRSLLPSNVKVMALTATATHSTYCTICNSLMSKDPVLIGCLPNRHNITYEVKPLLDMNSFCGSVAEEVKM
uniref:Helicase ATP-binding domain-containing protein n=1 Tax=Amphimedon queenslandica TaxID=400682 RepID=A0A1X7VJQ2_AMPQE